MFTLSHKTQQFNSLKCLGSLSNKVLNLNIFSFSQLGCAVGEKSFV